MRHELAYHQIIEGVTGAYECDTDDMHAHQFVCVKRGEVLRDDNMSNTTSTHSASLHHRVVPLKRKVTSIERTEDNGEYSGKNNIDSESDKGQQHPHLCLFAQGP